MVTRIEHTFMPFSDTGVVRAGNKAIDWWVTDKMPIFNMPVYVFLGNDLRFFLTPHKS